MLRREIERKQREEQEATAHAFQEFIKTFQDTAAAPNKTFVKSGVINVKPGQEIDLEKGKIYNPQPFIKQSSNTIKNAIECARLLKESKIEKPKGLDKPKTNLELLKEELKLRHMERDERSKYKNELALCSQLSSSECTDPTTTNLFIANINPAVTEQDLMQLFGAYGALGSVKIMWPRGEDKNRTTNCGFVAYMSRKDAERALQNLKDRDDMRVGWGKPVELSANPVYIPPELLKLSLPPPYSGLPFNAQPLKTPYIYPTNEDDMRELLFNSVVKVTIPLDKKLLLTVHRVLEFVLREGPLFEAMIMNREINNPVFQFLFDNKNPVHVYYRWKLYSLLHGEGQKTWSTKEFRMFEGGSIWIPPVVPNYSSGMPENLIYKHPKVNKALLSDAQKFRFIQLLQNLSLNRLKIGEAMVFCMNHIEAAKDIVDIITESFEKVKTKPTKKIARLYVLNDVLLNSNIKKYDASYFSRELMKNLSNIFQQLQNTVITLNTTVDKDAVKIRVQRVLRSWDLHKIYPNDFLNKLESTFLGISLECETENDSGADEPLDGENLIKRSIKNRSIYLLNNPDNDTSKKPAVTQDILPGFIPSRWETVDPEQVEAQAMSTKKFYDLEMERKAQEQKTLQQITEQSESRKILDFERKMLRNVEVMVMQYQDELESGKCRLPKDMSLEKAIKNYRKNLLDKIQNEYEKKQHIRNDSSEERDRKDKAVKNKRYKRRDSKSKESEKDRKRYSYK